MYGLEVLARGSKSQIDENCEAGYIYFSEVYNRDDDERNWSFSYLREQLLLKNSQELFRKYQIRIQHALFVELLAFNIVYNAVSLAAYVFLPDEAELEKDDLKHRVVTVGRLCRSISLIVQFSVFVASYKESIFRSPNAKIAVAACVLLCMTVGEMGTSIYRLFIGSPESIVRHVYYIVLTTTVLLPFPRKLYSAISGAAVITIDLMLSSLSNLDRKNVTIVMLADITFHGTTLAVGLGIRYLIEVMSRRAFLDRRECIESKIKIETAKYQEDKFLLSILPSHIAKEVREDIRHVMKNMDKIPFIHKPFNKLYVEKHKGVSILYADIVNSMLLAASLKVTDLVETLNDLFGRFDSSAEKNGCMRINLLGDCYYCVSGIPDKNLRHADNCVHTGLDMIDIIRTIREKRSVNVDMRIGIHSGNILGGLIGLRKWQFDIWSRDVNIASHVEQGGVPGQVHITKTTKEYLQDDIYDIYPGHGHLRDAYLQSLGIETFLIKPRGRLTSIAETAVDSVDSVDSPRLGNGTRFHRQASSISSRSNISRLSNRQSSSDSILPMGRRGALVTSLEHYGKMVSRVNKIMEKSIDKMALSKRDQWFSKVGIQPLLLTFRESGREGPFFEQPDPLFKYYLLCMILIFCGMTVIHLLIVSSTLEFWMSYGVLLLLILSACIPSWAGYIWLSCKKDESDRLLDSTVLKISRTVWKKTILRVIIWLTISAMIIFCSVAGLNECFEHSFFKSFDDINGTQTAGNDTDKVQDSDNISCSYPWFYTLSAALAMTTTSVFLRIHFLMKLAVNGTALLAFWYIIDFRTEELFSRKQTAKLADWDEFGLPGDLSHCYFLTFIVLILHILDRQVEYICRLDFLMKVRLKAEQEESRSMERVNRFLLFNILPPHVSLFYLNRQMEDESTRNETPYNEECTSVAVMFASIPNYADFYYEDGENEEGLRCIQLLNEIICLFDMLLNESEFHSVEKMKTIGSTYMAACGLQSHEKGPVVTEGDPATNVLTLTRFAVAMMAALQELNIEAMQDFQLRIGISVGTVMAGVVGTVKPQFDIWGDAVNVASRMDSTGIPGRIQITKEVADLLSSSDCPYDSECRGEIFVKGKGMLKTYLLKTPYDEPQIQTTSL